MSSFDQLYPNFDSEVWLRSCEQEVDDPIEGKITGEMPYWLRGTLLRNGPGSLKVGPMRYEHLFDSASLLHRFGIQDGGVTYQCRFLRSNTFNKNRAANRIVVTEFGTKAVPDPCHTIFDRIDPKTLDTLERKNLRDSIAVVNHSAHPHIMPNGDVYNIGMSRVNCRIRHVVVKFPFNENGDMFEKAHIVGQTKPRWELHPAYMHTFGITENYFVIVEQPLSISLLRIMKNLLTNAPFANCFKWYPEYETHIVLISRKTGEEVKRYRTETLFYLHIINTFEQDGKLVVDLCAYKDAKAMDAMYTHAIETMQSNTNYAEWTRSRPKRIEILLNAPQLTYFDATVLVDYGCETPRIHYDLYNGRPYRYFYAISSDVDGNPGSLIKVDTMTGEVKTWDAVDCYLSEPIFVPAPNAKEEDEGVLLSPLVWGSNQPRAVALLVLDARSLREIARAEFATPSSVPRCLHGWFVPERA
ncbi:carotenoid isomerooxygenase-like isoform X2 [Hyposmocoma kahamanoa]|uniref:carotenoid isomerooxygenase-like isoform X2 n=1 Tax=Hyposmocoma kahamanoa TaxID=1477025 RepID=UPI000E6D91FB|nr:carotenoid isomerooxygenase-like isoform X2 [Hyposmocoma kahamanoa]